MKEIDVEVEPAMQQSIWANYFHTQGKDGFRLGRVADPGGQYLDPAFKQMDSQTTFGKK